MAKRRRAPRPIVGRIGPQPQTGQDVYEAVRAHYGGIPERDMLLALLLNRQHEVLEFRVLSLGIPTAESVPVSVNLGNAAAVVLARIDAGDGTLTTGDRAIFTAMKDTLEIPVVDYLVVAEGTFFSFAEQELF